MKLITLQQATAQGYTQNEYQKNSLNSEIKDLEGFGEVVPMVFTSIHDGKTHFEFAKALIKVNGILLSPHKRYNKNSFGFLLAQPLRVTGFNHELPTPPKVGKPTPKKMLAWLEYLQAVEALKEAFLAQKTKKETDFFNKIKDAGLKIYHQSNDGKRGYIQTKDFEFSFEVFSDGSINQKITLRCGNTIDDFLKLVSGAKN